MQDRDDEVDATAAAWLRERPGTPTEGIGIVTRIWRLAKLFGDDRRRTLTAAGADPATLDLLSVLRRAGPPYRLSTRQITEQSRVTAGAISQRIARAEQSGLVERASVEGSKTVTVTLTSAGHSEIDRLVDQVLGREAQLVSRLTSGDRAELTRLLRLLLGDVQDQLGETDRSQVGTP